MHETIILAYSETEAYGSLGGLGFVLGGLWLLYLLLPGKKKK